MYNIVIRHLYNLQRDYSGKSSGTHLIPYIVITIFTIFPMLYFTFPWLFLWDFTYLFSQRGEGKEKEREENINVWLALMLPLLGIWPTTQACALTGNWTSNPLICRTALNLLSHTSQGNGCFYNWQFVHLNPVPFFIHAPSMLLLSGNHQFVLGI